MIAYLHQKLSSVIPAHHEKATKIGSSIEIWMNDFVVFQNWMEKNRVYTRVPSRIFIVTTSLLCIFFSLPHSLVIVSPFFVPLVYSLVLLFAPSACNRALYTHAIFGICYIYIIFYRVNWCAFDFFFSLSSQRSSFYYWLVLKLMLVLVLHVSVSLAFGVVIWTIPSATRKAYCLICFRMKSQILFDMLCVCVCMSRIQFETQKALLHRFYW